MSEALFRIPSRTVTYGYVEVSVDLGHSDPEIIAATYVSWVHAFQKEEEATIERLKDAPSGALKAPLAASEEYSEEGARRIIEDGLGPVTELPNEVPEGGALPREAGELEAPWESKLAPKPKPWESETLPPAVVDPAW